MMSIYEHGGAITAHLTNRNGGQSIKDGTVQHGDTRVKGDVESYR